MDIGSLAAGPLKALTKGALGVLGAKAAFGALGVSSGAGVGATRVALHAASRSRQARHAVEVGRKSARALSEAQGGERLYRIGKEAESVEKLAAQARKASKAKIGLRKVKIHGVSVSASPLDKPSSTALREAIEKHFVVHNTPTRKNPLHRTVELPDPVTTQAAELFNRLFGRLP